MAPFQKNRVSWQFVGLGNRQGQIDCSGLSFGTFIANLQLGGPEKSSKTIFAVRSIFASDALKPTGCAGIFGVVAVKPVGRSIPHPLQPHDGIGKYAKTARHQTGQNPLKRSTLWGDEKIEKAILV